MALIRFADFVHKIGGEPMPRNCFAIPNTTLALLREAAGSQGQLVAHSGYVTVTFHMVGGAAVVTGFQRDDRIEMGWVFFAPSAERERGYLSSVADGDDDVR